MLMTEALAQRPRAPGQVSLQLCGDEGQAGLQAGKAIKGPEGPGVQMPGWRA